MLSARIKAPGTVLVQRGSFPASVSVPSPSNPMGVANSHSCYFRPLHRHATWLVTAGSPHRRATVCNTNFRPTGLTPAQLTQKISLGSAIPGCNRFFKSRRIPASPLTAASKRPPIATASFSQSLAVFPQAAAVMTLALSPVAILSGGINGQDVAAGAFTLVASLVWVGLFNELARRELIEQKLSRKLVHISTGLLFMLTWALYSSSPTAPWFACVAPLTNCIRLTVLGLGIVRDPGMVRSITREGKTEELLRGPLYYSLTLLLVTLLCWRTSPVGVTAMAMMCGGDGIADIVGRRAGEQKLPWNPQKSWAGSASMFLFGSALALIFINLFCSLGYFPCPNWSSSAILRVLAVALGSTLVESLPISSKLDDNLTVPLSGAVLAMLLLPLEWQGGIQ